MGVVYSVARNQSICRFYAAQHVSRWVPDISRWVVSSKATICWLERVGARGSRLKPWLIGLGDIFAAQLDPRAPTTSQRCLR